jgi:hypothetical protein
MQTTLPAQITPQAPGSSWTPDPAANAVAGHLNSAIAWYGQKPMLHRERTPAEVDVLKRRLSVVRKTLLPATGESDRKRSARASTSTILRRNASGLLAKPDLRRSVDLIGSTRSNGTVTFSLAYML